METAFNLPVVYDESRSKAYEFVVEQFRKWSIPTPKEQTLKTLLAQTWDWSSNFMWYYYELLGIDIISMEEQLFHANSSYPYTYHIYTEDSDWYGKGLYLIVRKGPSQYQARMEAGPELDNQVRNSMIRWAEYHPIKIDDYHFLNCNPDKDRQIITATWAAMNWFISPYGEADLCALFPWHRELCNLMDNYIVEYDGNYHIYQSQGRGQIGGAAMLIDYYELHDGEDYFMESISESLHHSPDPEYSERVKKILDTGEESANPIEFQFKHRTVNDCRECGARLECVAPVYLETGDYEASQFFLCANCLAKSEYHDGVMEQDPEKIMDPETMCLGRSLNWIIQHGLDRMTCVKIISRQSEYNRTSSVCRKLGIDNYVPFEKLLNFVNERGIDDKLLKVAVGTIFMNHSCYSQRWGAHCSNIDYTAVANWFVSLRTNDLIRRMEIGMYEQHKRLGGIRC